MKWKSISMSKRGFIIGIILGAIFGVYSSITKCHINFFFNSATCTNPVTSFIALVEFIFWVVPMVILMLIAPSFANSVGGFKIIVFISPVIILGLLGLLAGFIIGKFKRK